MFKLGPISEGKLGTCHTDLQLLGHVAIRRAKFDFACTDGYRGDREQQIVFDAGRSQKAPGKSLHNISPSLAVHFEPFPILYPLDTDTPVQMAKKLARYYMLAMHILRTAEDLALDIRWGGDWDRDYDILDQTFDDLAHFELINDSAR